MIANVNKNKNQEAIKKYYSLLWGKVPIAEMFPISMKNSPPPTAIWGFLHFYYPEESLFAGNSKTF